MADRITGAEIIAEAERTGIDSIGFAPVSRWKTEDPVRPESIWPDAKTVIVLGAPIWLPLIEATPSVSGREQIFVTAKLLEKAAYRIVLLLNRQGSRTFDIPRYPPGSPVSDPPPASEYAGKNDPKKLQPEAYTGFTWFPAETAGYYAGLGTPGRNRRLLTNDYGPRFELKALLTDLEIEPRHEAPQKLCVDCGNCEKICSLVKEPAACLRRQRYLARAYCDCSDCLRVCPVGKDRELFGSFDFERYFAERETLDSNPLAAEYRSWVHLRSYGSADLKDVPEETQ